MQDVRTPDQVDGTTVDRPTPAGMPTWPTNPQPIAKPVATTSTPVADDNGIDGGVLVALGGGALLVVGGIGLAGRKRQQLGAPAPAGLGQRTSGDAAIGGVPGTRRRA